MISIEPSEPVTAARHPALLVLHGAGGAVDFWFQRFAPLLAGAGIAAYAPHYFEKTRTSRPTREQITDGRHFPAWLGVLKDAVGYVAGRPGVDPGRIGVLGVSLGGYLAMALAVDDLRVRAAIEVSGGMPPEWAPRVSASMPPVLAVHGLADTVVPVSEAHALDRLLAERGIAHRMELLPGEGHWFSPAAVPRLLAATSSFLTEHLLPVKVKGAAVR